jgi:hypothetical protein
MPSNCASIQGQAVKCADAHVMPLQELHISLTTHGNHRTAQTYISDSPTRGLCYTTALLNELQEPPLPPMQPFVLSFIS